jgi:hypothetical protein
MVCISDCCLLVSGREAEERPNHENKIDGHLFHGTVHSSYVEIVAKKGEIICHRKLVEVLVPIG